MSHCWLRLVTMLLLLVPVQAEVLDSGHLPAVGAADHIWFLLPSEKEEGQWDLCHSGHHAIGMTYRIVRRLGHYPAALAAWNETLWVLMESSEAQGDRFDVYQLRAEYQASLDVYVMEPREGLSALPPLTGLKSIRSLVGSPSGLLVIGNDGEGDIARQLSAGRWQDWNLPSGIDGDEQVLATTVAGDGGVLLLSVKHQDAIRGWLHSSQGHWTEHALTISGQLRSLLQIDGQPLLVSLTSMQQVDLHYIQGSDVINLAQIPQPPKAWTVVGLTGRAVLVESTGRSLEVTEIDALTGESKTIGRIEPAGLMTTGIWSIAVAVGLASLVVMVVVLARGGDLARATLPDGVVPMSPLPRLAALCVDLIPGLIVFFLLVGGTFRELVRAPMMSLSTDDVVPYALLVAMTVLWCLICEGLTGSTLGKWIFGGRVISTRSERLAVWQVLIRNLIKGLILLVPPLALLTLLHPNQQGLGDLLSRTVVARSAVPLDST